MCGYPGWRSHGSGPCPPEWEAGVIFSSEGGLEWGGVLVWMVGVCRVDTWTRHVRDATGTAMCTRHWGRSWAECAVARPGTSDMDLRFEAGRGAA